MKKSVLQKALCVLLACALALPAVFSALAGTPAEDAHLHFDKDGKFRILNFSDIQDDESLDDRVKLFLRQAVCTAQPDLIVLTGDNIHGTNVSPDKTQTAIAEFMTIFESLGVPVAIVFGNHDDEGGTSKETQMAIYNSYSVNVSYDEGGTLDGCGTYNVPIYGSTETDKVKFNLWMFDTGSNSSSGYDHMRDSQLSWYVQKSNELKAANGGRLVPSIAFQHIIVKEIFNALKKVSIGTSGAVRYNLSYYVLPDTAAPGSVMKEHPCPSSGGDEFSVVRQQGDVLAIVSGHDHTNSFIVPYQGIDLINTPGTGFYSYGNDALRGARIIDLDEQSGTYSTETLLLRDLTAPQYYVPTGARRYVKNLALCVAQSAQYGGCTEAAIDAAYNRLYAAVDAANGNGVVQRVDLNGGRTADQSSVNHYVVLAGYTLTENVDEAMRGLSTCYTGTTGDSGAQYDGATANGLVWNLCNQNGLAVAGTDGCVDLNAGTTGGAIYFIANYGSSAAALTEIRIVTTGPDDAIDMGDFPGYTLVSPVLGKNTGTSYADANKSAKGDYVYALYRTVSDGATRIPLDTLPLLEARFNAVKRMRDPETVCSDESAAALQSVLADADAILQDLANDGQTTVYDQTALNRTANRIDAGIQNLSLPAFTLTFDAAGGRCAETTRTIRFGQVLGTLPTAQRTRFVLDGWYTDPVGGDPVTADTVYDAKSDRTWYAHWLPDPDWLAGDADQTGIVDLRDVTAMQRFLAGGWNVTVEFDHADVNADGKLDLRDVMLLRRYFAGGWDVVLV